MLTPIAGSMIADASEIGRCHTGVLKDGSYSAVYSCITKLSISAGIMLSGQCLDGAGFLVGGQVQTPQALRNLALVTFVGGAVLAMVAMLALLRYPVTQAFMSALRENAGQRTAVPASDYSSPVIPSQVHE